MNRPDDFPAGGMEGLADLEAAFAELADAARAFPDHSRGPGYWELVRIPAAYAIGQFLPPEARPDTRTPEQVRYGEAMDAATEAAMDWMGRDGADPEAAAETVMCVARRAAFA